MVAYSGGAQGRVVVTLSKVDEELSGMSGRVGVLDGKVRWDLLGRSGGGDGHC